MAGASHSAKALVYYIDDGTAENALAINNSGGGTLLALNEFTVSPGNTTINSISMAFGGPRTNGSNASLLGESFTVMLYSDPSGNGAPRLRYLADDRHGDCHEHRHKHLPYSTDHADDDHRD